MNAHLSAPSVTSHPGDSTALVLRIIGCLTMLALAGLALPAAAFAQPVVSNVTAVPRPGTKLVDIAYALSHASGLPSTVRVEVSRDGGATYTTATSVSGAVGAGITPGSGKSVSWNAGQDLLAVLLGATRIRVLASDGPSAAAMLPIPAGTFVMGDTRNDRFSSDELPTHPVTLSAFFMHQTEVSFAQWREIVDWNASGNRGYDFAAGQRGTGPSLSALPDTPSNNTHPVTFVSWFDVAKWCNARSRKEGLTPCFYTDATFTTEFKTGTPTAVFCNFTADGYRLPTEAEWEYAARGGLANPRYPWGDTVVPGQANYGGNPTVIRPLFDSTTPVGYYNGQQVPAGPDMKNGYGLYDMGGNVAEWVWDWQASYPAAAQTDPRGPETGTFRGVRGGDWLQTESNLRVADREMFTPPTARGGGRSFRPVRSFLTAAAGGSAESAAFVLDLRNPGGAPSSRLANLSVRTAMSADQTLIVGIVVSGGARSVVVRAVGPGLANFGIGGTMADPQLELFNGATRLLANDNWQATLATTFSSVGAFPLTVGSRDAAFVQEIDGARSITTRGTGPGVVLVEAYDTGTSNNPRLVNVSARNRVGTGDSILIAGFNLTGTGPKQVLIRAVGPTLGSFQVPGFLADPVLELFSANGTRIAENDNWTASLAQLFSAVGAFPFGANSRDAALAIQLNPGSYTVQVRGTGETTGEALVEIYEVPDGAAVN